MKQKQTLIVRGYSLTPEVYAIIREVSFERRLGNTSKALRQIVLEWHKLTGGERAKTNEPSIPAV